MENMEDFRVSQNYTQRDLLLLLPLSSPLAAAAAAAIHTYPRGAAAIALKFHPKHVTNKNKTKHTMKISHINVNIYDKTTKVNKIVIKILNKHEN
jgi:hypothetical protein